jgi:hypothetical protein
MLSLSNFIAYIADNQRALIETERFATALMNLPHAVLAASRVVGT